jgi:hypothetical protein
MFFLDKAAYGTLVLINMYIYNHCHMLKVYVKIVVGIHKSGKNLLNSVSKHPAVIMWGEPRFYSRCVYHKCQPELALVIYTT